MCFSSDISSSVLKPLHQSDKSITMCKCFKTETNVLAQNNSCICESTKLYVFIQEQCYSPNQRNGMKIIHLTMRKSQPVYQYDND